MSRKLPSTPRSRVKNALRQVWLRSRERAAALKSAAHRCERCGVKGRAKDTRNGPAQKLEVHHRDGVPNWESLTDLVYRRLLCPPDRLVVLCPECHGEEHEMAAVAHEVAPGSCDGGGDRGGEGGRG